MLAAGTINGAPVAEPGCFQRAAAVGAGAVSSSVHLELERMRREVLLAGGKSAGTSRGRTDPTQAGAGNHGQKDRAGADPGAQASPGECEVSK